MILYDLQDTKILGDIQTLTCLARHTLEGHILNQIWLKCVHGSVPGKVFVVIISKCLVISRDGARVAQQTEIELKTCDWNLCYCTKVDRAFLVYAYCI